MNFLKHDTGFTLLEVMVVVIIMGVLVALAVPSMSGITTNSKLYTATNLLKRVLTVAKTRALADPTVHVGVCFDTTAGAQRVFAFRDYVTPANYSYDGSGDSTYGKIDTIPKGVTLSIPAAMAGRCLFFRGDGSAKSQGTVRLTAGGKTRTITVNTSGRIKVTAP